MTAQELAAKFAAENPEAAGLLRAEGAAGELARVNAVRAQAIPGHEALVEKLAADGKTTGPEAAMAVLAAERGARQAQAQARADDAPPPVNVVSEPPAAPAAKLGNADLINNPEALDKAAQAYMAANKGVSYQAAVSAVLEG